MTELVEQGNHFVMGEQRRFAAYRTVEVTGQVGDRFLQGTVGFTHLAYAVVHPRPAALVLTRVEIEVEAAAQLVFLVIQLEEAHVRVPDVDIGTLFGGDAIDALYHFEQAVNGFVFREVRAQLLVADAVEMLLLFFAVVRDIPRLQLVHAELRFREGAQLGQLFLTLRTGAFRQIGQEVEHLLRVLRHFGGEGFIGVVFEAQQLRQLVTQGEDFRHYRAVVPLTGIRPLIGGAGAVRTVHLFAQGLVVAVGHHRQIARDIKRQQEAFLLFRFGLGFCRRQRAFRHTGQLSFVGNQLRPAHGGVEHVVAVLVAQLGQTRGNFAVAGLLLFWQANPGQLKITQGVIDRFFLRRAQFGIMVAVAQVAVGFVQPFVLTDPGAVLREQRQGLFVGFAQFRAVFYRVQVAHRGEDTPQHVVHFGQRLTQIFPGVRRALRYHAFYRRAAVVQRLRNGWNNMLREDFRKRRQRKRRQ